MKKLRIFILLVLTLTACTSDQDSEFFAGALGSGTPKILVASGLNGSYAVVMYDINGNFIKIVKNYADNDLIPRGLAAVNGSEFLISVDRIDHINRMNYVTLEETFIAHAYLAGNIYQLRRHPDYGIFVPESTVVESFDDNGARIGAPRIPATVGACSSGGTSTKTMDFDLQGRLIVANINNDDINMYDVSDPSNTICVTSNTSMGNINPVGVLAHSNGNIYVATQGDDSIYEFPSDLSGSGTVIFNNTGIINNPTSIAEMPDGTLLIGSNSTDAIVRIQTDGTLVNSSFIGDAFTNVVNDILIIQEGAQ